MCAIKPSTQPQLILCSHRGTGQCTGKNVANTKPTADCLSQQHCLCFLVTISWQFYIHLCRVIYILKSNRCAYIKVHSNSQNSLYMNVSMNICIMQQRSQAGHLKLPFSMRKHVALKYFLSDLEKKYFKFKNSRKKNKY